jgi:hypothetical protein
VIRSHEAGGDERMGRTPPSHSQQFDMEKTV